MTTTLWRKWLRQCGGNDTNIAEETTTTLWRKQQLHWGRNDYDIAKETTRTLQRKWSRHWGGNNNDIAETMNSHRPRSQNTAKEQALIPEKESRRTWPRCHVSLEKSSKNHKPLTSHHSQRTFVASIYGGFATWWAQIRQNYLPYFLATEDGQNRGEGGVICGLI